MNVETIHKISELITKDNQKLQAFTHLNSAHNALQNMVQQPQNGQYQQNLVKSLQDFYHACEKSFLNELSPAWYQMLEELNVVHLYGNNLKNKIELIMSQNSITPENARQEIHPILIELKKVNEGFQKMIEGFASVNIEKDDLGENENEIGVMIPRVSIDNSLAGLEKEIKEMNLILNKFTELVLGEKQILELRTLSTTEPLITIGTCITVAIAFGKSVSFILDQYKKVLEIRELHNKLAKEEIGEDVLKGIEAHCETLIGEKIVELADNLDNEYQAITDEKRKKEVMNGIRISLNKIANRIDQGFNYEVRLSIEEKTADEEIENNDLANEELKEIMTNLQFINTSGKPILRLDEPEIDSK